MKRNRSEEEEEERSPRSMKRSRRSLEISPPLPATTNSSLCSCCGAVPATTLSSSRVLSTYLKKAVREVLLNDRNEEFRRVLKDFQAGKVGIAGVTGRVNELVLNPKPKGYDNPLDDDDDDDEESRRRRTLLVLQLDQAIAYVNRVKARFQEQDEYQIFVEIFSVYRDGGKSAEQVYRDVAALFRDHKDLLEEFKHFLPQDSTTAAPAAAAAPLLQPDDRCTVLRPRGYKRKSADESKQSGQVAKLGPRPSLHRDELICTPSYRLLATPAAATAPSHPVLNVSATLRTEGHGFKAVRKNRYEKRLFACEDERYAMDMRIESAAHTARRVKVLMEKMQQSAEANIATQFPLEKHLSPVNLRCIQSLHDAHGLDLLDALRENAALALPLILRCLKQKQEEWSRCRADMNKVWARVCANNHHKALGYM